MLDWNRVGSFQTLLLCVDQYEQGIPSGYFCTNDPEFSHVPFNSLVQLLTGIEHLLNKANHPQSYMAMRTFTPMPQPEFPEADKTHDQKGDRGTFLLKILFRQNTSWQGSVTWIEGKDEQPFRSVLELLMIIDSALAE